MGSVPLRSVVFVLCITPFIGLVIDGLNSGLGPDPAEQVMGRSGQWALRMLLLTLLVSPLRQWTAWSMILSCRRILGLFSFFYASMHLASFSHFYIAWQPSLLLEELIKRSYIAAGLTAWLLMLPLAITSSKAWQRRLRRNWRKLHRLIYPATLLACLHLLWQARSDIGESLVYTGLATLLLAWRLIPKKGSKGTL